jgi:hypothetical protein
VRNQMGKESARPQALLYVVPKFCASAIWPFFKASPHPDWARYSRRGKPISSGITRCNDFAPEIEPRALGMGVLHPPRCCILMGVAFSWRCITRLSVLFRHFSSAGLSVLPSHRRVPPPLRSRELSLCRLAVCSTTPHILAAARKQRFPQTPSVQELPPIVVIE